MLKIAICDDMKSARENLIALLQASQEIQFDKFEFSEYDRGSDLYQEITAGKHYDIIFMDIDMKEMDGIETGKNILSYDSQVKIIYVTNYDYYQGMVLDLHAFGYLTKPIKMPLLEKTFLDALRFLEDQDAKKSAQILFETDAGSIAFRYAEIYYFQSSGHNVHISTSKGIFRIFLTLAQVEKQLRGHNFYYCHKSYIVNLMFVRQIVQCDIKLLNGDTVSLGQKKAAAFKKAFNDYLQTAGS